MKTEMCAGKYFVSYAAGSSRFDSDRAIDYMIAAAPDSEGYPIELYAEEETDPDDGIATYEDLKAEIIQQAKVMDVDPDVLMFFYDREDQEIEYIEI